MQPISDIPDDEFMRIQAAYGEELPICPVCALEDVRHVLSELVFEAPKKAMSEDVRQTIKDLLHVVIGALVTNRSDVEQEDHSAQ